MMVFISALRTIRVVVIRSHLKKKILVQDQGGVEFQPAGILKYVEDLKRRPNAEIGPKDFFEIALSSNINAYERGVKQLTGCGLRVPGGGLVVLKVIDMRCQWLED
jgi:hypothetical protein